MGKNKKNLTIQLEPEAFDKVEALSKELEASMTLILHAMIYTSRRDDVLTKINDLKKTFYDKTGPKPQKLENLGSIKI